MTDKKAQGAQKCISEANKTGVAWALDVVSAIQKCIDGRSRRAPPTGSPTACIGSFAAGFVLPTDAKTASSIEKLRAKTVSKLDEVRPGVGTWLPSVFACDGAESAVQLESCLLCEGWNQARCRSSSSSTPRTRTPSSRPARTRSRPR